MIALFLLLIPVLAVAIVPNNQIFNAYLVRGDQQFDPRLLRQETCRFPSTSVNSIASASPYLLPISLALLAKYALQAINGTIIGLYYLAFFFGNSLVGWVGGFYQTMRTTTFWLMHAGFAAASGLCFVIFKFVASHHLVEAG